MHIETHDGVVFTQQACVAEGEQESPLTVLSRTTLAEILKFVNEVPFAAIRFILDSAKLKDVYKRQVMFFAFSCLFTLSPANMAEAKAQNIPCLLYTSNRKLSTVRCQ